MIEDEHHIINDKVNNLIRKKSRWINNTHSPIDPEELARNMEEYTPLMECTHPDGYKFIYSIGTKTSSTSEGEPVKTIALFYRVNGMNKKELTPKQTEGFVGILEKLLDGLCTANLEKHKCIINSLVVNAPDYLLEELAKQI